MLSGIFYAFLHFVPPKSVNLGGLFAINMDVPCALNTVDVGIAVGSACAMAADMRVDTRVMFSAGLAAQRMNWLKDCKAVFAIPVSASSKNPFFDRKPKEEKK